MEVPSTWLSFITPKIVFPLCFLRVYCSLVNPQIINNIPTIRQGQVSSSCASLFQCGHAKHPIECSSREAAISPDPHMTVLAATVLPVVATPHLAAEVSQQRVVAARPMQMTVIDPDKTCAHGSRQHLCVHIDAHIQRQLINEDCQNLHFCLFWHNLSWFSRGRNIQIVVHFTREYPPPVPRSRLVISFQYTRVLLFKVFFFNFEV